MVVFVTNAVATVPLSAFLTDATEDIASHAGDFAGAILNVSLGNLVELILLCVSSRVMALMWNANIVCQHVSLPRSEPEPHGI